MFTTLFYIILSHFLRNFYLRIRNTNALQYFPEGNSDDSTDEQDPYEDDENEESNWRNDYPDEEDTKLYL